MKNAQGFFGIIQTTAPTGISLALCGLGHHYPKGLF